MVYRWNQKNHGELSQSGKREIGYWSKANISGITSTGRESNLVKI